MGYRIEAKMKKFVKKNCKIWFGDESVQKYFDTGIDNPNKCARTFWKHKVMKKFNVIKFNTENAKNTIPRDEKHKFEFDTKNGIKFGDIYFHILKTKDGKGLQLELYWESDLLRLNTRISSPKEQEFEELAKKIAMLVDENVDENAQETRRKRDESKKEKREKLKEELEKINELKGQGKEKVDGWLVEGLGYVNVPGYPGWYKYVGDLYCLGYITIDTVTHYNKLAKWKDGYLVLPCASYWNQYFENRDKVTILRLASMCLGVSYGWDENKVEKINDETPIWFSDNNYFVYNSVEEYANSIFQDMANAGGI